MNGNRYFNVTVPGPRNPKVRRFQIGTKLVDSLDVCEASGEIEAQGRRDHNLEVLVLQQHSQGWQWPR